MGECAAIFTLGRQCLVLTSRRIRFYLNLGSFGVARLAIRVVCVRAVLATRVVCVHAVADQPGMAVSSVLLSACRVV